jgi:hypothetical protein
MAAMATGLQVIFVDVYVRPSACREGDFQMAAFRRPFRFMEFPVLAVVSTDRRNSLVKCSKVNASTPASAGGERPSRCKRNSLSLSLAGTGFVLFLAHPDPLA